MKSLTFLFLMLASMTVASQATFILESIPEYTPPQDNIYIVGDFNGWDPGDGNYMMDQNNMDQWEIALDGFTNGTSIEYKFTRGDWGTVEKGPNGEEISNRQFTFGNGDTVYTGQKRDGQDALLHRCDCRGPGFRGR